jgi:hypothetical protein
MCVTHRALSVVWNLCWVEVTDIKNTRYSLNILLCLQITSYLMIFIIIIIIIIIAESVNVLLAVDAAH